MRLLEEYVWMSPLTYGCSVDGLYTNPDIKPVRILYNVVVISLQT